MIKKKDLEIVEKLNAQECVFLFQNIKVFSKLMKESNRYNICHKAVLLSNF